jgi:hypothetical protein
MKEQSDYRLIRHDVVVGGVPRPFDHDAELVCDLCVVRVSPRELRAKAEQRCDVQPGYACGECWEETLKELERSQSAKEQAEA